MQAKSPRFRPIHFSTSEVKAILDGTKTQTRRVMHPQPACGCRYEMNGAGTHALHLSSVPGREIVPVKATSATHKLPCPFNTSGDRLWVRETWAHDALSLADCRARREDVMLAAADLVGCGPYYRADPVHDGSGRRWVSPLYMPRWASRITLGITDVRCERLHSITSDDAEAEGIRYEDAHDVERRTVVCPLVDQYADLWDSTNSATPWTSNPWVWVLSFSRL